MRVHANAPLTIEGRRRLVELILGGLSVREAARVRGVSPATAHRWITRWTAASEDQRRSLSCFTDRSSRPHHQPRRSDPDLEARILEARARTNLGPARLAHIVGAPPSTIWKVLKRHGRSRGACAPRPITKRYEWAEAGALIHIDTAKLARFDTPGHRTRGRTARTARTEGLGFSVIHVAIDDHSRYAYIEQHTDEKGETCARFLQRALIHFTDLGMKPAEAVMTDNARNYRSSNAFQEILRAAGAKHILTPPYTPRVNGKAERFIQTMKREWAYAHEWPSSRARTRALGSWLRTYNRRRLHSGIGNRPPISRVHNVCE
ncbi:MAG: IS481 family transposase [Betaproteobacteria bacterium]